MQERDVRAHALVGMPLLAAAALLAALGTSGPVDVADVLLFLLAAALVCRLGFETAAGPMVPTQLILVPMLFVLDPAIVPIVVVGALTLDRLPDVLKGRLPGRRLLGVWGEGWFAFGPAIVFVVAGVEGPHWGDWPVWLLALGAQFGGELIAALTRDRLAGGAAPRQRLDVLLEVWLVDLLLAPVGLLAAFVSGAHHYAFGLVLALALLLAVFARERRGRIGTELELSETYRGTALLLGEVISSDGELAVSHGQEVVALALALADELHLDERERRLVEFAAMLHDIGKIETPEEILRKPGPLTAQEWETMRVYTVAGQRMLDRVGGTLHDVGLVVRSSCERYAGDGYPDALAGQQIPLAARVLAVAGSYVAMTASRPYRGALAPAAAIAELRANAGTQFDPRIVDAACVVLARGVPEAPAQGAPAPI
jgi:HD-GYP domain-containing protein (c-di-GMP phosphodiesterase class II)